MQWFYNFKVARKLTILVSAMVLFFLLTSAMSFNSLTRIADNVDTMYNWMLIPIIDLENAVSHYLELQKLILQLKASDVAGGSAAELLNQMRSHVAAIKEIVNQYLAVYALFEDPSSVDLFTRAGKADLLTLEKESAEWLVKNFDSLWNAVENHFLTLDWAAWDVTGEPLLNEGRNRLAHLVSINKEAAALVKNESESEYISVRNKLSIAVLVVTLVSITIALAITRSITKPLKAINELAQAIASGDLTATAAVRSKDDLGEMANALNHAVENLRKIVVSVLELADGVLKSSQELSASAEEVSASIEEVASAANQFAATVEVMNTNAQEVSHSTSDIAETIAASSEDMSTAVSRIEGLRATMNALAKAIHELNNKSQEIGNIVDLIKDVADQTNLLALNAAIEAARAGEHGRGFAVVADEVRKLAEQTTAATADVTALVTDMQRQAKAVMTESDSGALAADASSGLIKESWKKLDAILRTISNIAKDLEHLAAGTEQIGSGSQEIAATTEEQSASVEHVAAAAQKLNDTAEKLQRSIAFFKV